MSRSLTNIPKSRATRSTPGGPPDDPNFFRTIRLLLQGQFTDPYSQHPWVYAGAQGIAGPLSQLPFRLYRVTGKSDAGETAQRSREHRILEVAPNLGKKAAQAIASFSSSRARAFELRRAAPWLRRLELVRAIGDVEPVEDGEWYRLFERPNPTLVPAQLWEATYVDLSTSGECFWILLGKTGEKCREDEIPSEVWPTQGGDRWEPVRDKRTKTPKAWKDKGEGVHSFEVVYPHGSFLQARYLNPRDPLRGLSPLEPIALEIKTDYRAQQFNLAFLENGAMAGGWFTTEKAMQEKDAGKWIKDFEARHGGARKAGRPGLLTHGVKFTPNQASFAEMQYQAGRATSRDNILSAGFKTTKNALGLSGDQNRASMLASLRNHWDSVLLPKSHYLEDLLAAQLFTPARNGGQEIFGLFDTSVVAALREDLTDRLAAAEMMQALGWTANQINEALELGLPPLPWGDAWWPEFGRSPINAAPAAGQTGGGSVVDEPDDGDDPGDDPDADEGKSARGRRLRLLPSTLRRRVGGEGWDAIRRSVLGPGEDRHARRFRRFLYDLRKAQLERIREEGGRGGAEALAFDLSEWKTKVAAAMRETYRAIVAAAAKKAEAELAELGKKSKSSVVRASKETVDFIAEGLGLRIGRVVGTIRKQLVRVMAAAESEDPEELADEVRAAFNDLIVRGKLGVIARTETSAANNLAREAVFEEAGIEREEWLTADDELVRETHVVYGEAESQPRGTNWATLSGNSYTLRFPHDPQAPAAETVNCFLPGTAVGGAIFVASKAFYSGAARRIETDGGHRLSVTANHPILTGRGWLAAKEVREGDHLLCDRVDTHSSVLGHVDDQYSEATVDEVFQALAADRGSRPAVARARDLHGEAQRFRNGHIDIVAVNREILDRAVARFSESRQDLALVANAGMVRSSLAGERPILELGGGRLRAEPSRVRGCDLSATRGLAHAAPLDPLLFGLVAKRHLEIAEYAVDEPPIPSDALGECEHALAGLVEVRKVARAESFAYIGPVFDLQDAAGFVHGNGIIARNCRCVLIPVAS